MRPPKALITAAAVAFVLILAGQWHYSVYLGAAAVVYLAFWKVKF